MKMAQVKEKARLVGVKAGRMKKADLIRAVQVAEGNTPCFGMAQRDCDQVDCCWREDCMVI